MQARRVPSNNAANQVKAGILKSGGRYNPANKAARNRARAIRFGGSARLHRNSVIARENSGAFNLSGPRSRGKINLNRNAANRQLIRSPARRAHRSNGRDHEAAGISAGEISRIADCGWVIADCIKCTFELGVSIRNPQSEIRNPTKLAVGCTGIAAGGLFPW